MMYKDNSKKGAGWTPANDEAPTPTELMLPSLINGNPKDLASQEHAEIEEYAQCYENLEAVKKLYLLLNNAKQFDKGFIASINRAIERRISTQPVSEDIFIERFNPNDIMPKGLITKYSGFSGNSIDRNKDNYHYRPFKGVYIKSFLTWLRVNHLDVFNAFKANFERQERGLPILPIETITNYQVRLIEQAHEQAQLPPQPQVPQVPVLPQAQTMRIWN